jgi:hypothetical protein
LRSPGIPVENPIAVWGFLLFLNAGLTVALLLIGIFLFVDLVAMSIKLDAMFLEEFSVKLAKPHQYPSQVKKTIRKAFRIKQYYDYLFILKDLLNTYLISAA